MVHDLITEEIRATRQRLAAQFDNDVFRIGDDLRRREATSGRRIRQLSGLSPRADETTDGAIERNEVPTANS